MYEYQSNNIYFAQVTGMMEELGQQELQKLGATDTKLSYRGVYFKADHETLYRINYTSRLLSRVLAPLKNFYCDNTGVLKKTADTIEWDDFLTVDNTFSITSSVANSKINNSLYASQCLKDGIADYFRNKFGKRPDVDTVNPDVRFNLFIEKDSAVISLDTSGDSLHKRGYRLLAGEAPMQETLAAAIIQLSNWDGQNILWDPMCGSGTILCEALMHYCRIPAQKLRKNFGLFYLPDFNNELWKKVKDESESQIRPLPKGLIKGSDKSQRILEVAKDNLSRLPYSNNIELAGHPFEHVKEFKDGTLITNPPYGIRLGNPEDVQVLYKELGDFIKQRCTGTNAFIYTGEPSLRKHIGLKTSRRIHLVNGKLEGVLLMFDSYEGTKKKFFLKEEGSEKTKDKVEKADAKAEAKEEKYYDRFDESRKEKFGKKDEDRKSRRFDAERKSRWDRNEKDKAKAEPKEERFDNKFDMRRKEKFGRKDEDRKSRSFDERRKDKFERKDEDWKSKRFDAERKSRWDRNEKEKAKVEAKDERFDFKGRHKFEKNDEERNYKRSGFERKSRWDSGEKRKYGNENRRKAEAETKEDRFNFKRKKKFEKNDEERNYRKSEFERKSRWNSGENRKKDYEDRRKFKAEAKEDRFDFKRKNKFEKNDEERNYRKSGFERKSRWDDREKRMYSNENRRKVETEAKEDRFSDRSNFERNEKSWKNDLKKNPRKRFGDGEYDWKRENKSKNMSESMSKSKIGNDEIKRNRKSNEFQKKSDEKMKNKNSFEGVKDFGMRKGKGGKR